MGEEVHEHRTCCGAGSQHSPGDGLCGEEQQKGENPASHSDNHRGEAQLRLARPYHDVVLLDQAREHAVLQDSVRQA